MKKTKQTQTGSGKENKEVRPPADFLVDGLNREHLASAFGVSVRTIAAWLVKGLPRKDSGFFLPDCISWFASQQPGKCEKTGKPQEQDSPEKSQWLEAYRKERARMARLDRRARQGSLLPRTEVEKAFADRAFEFARGILHLSRRVAHKVAEKGTKPLREVEKILDSEARRLLDEYSRPIEVKEGPEK